MLRGKNLQKVYNVFSSVYLEKIGSQFSFQSGERGRAKNIFTYTSEAMGIRDASRMDEVLDMLQRYLSDKTSEWLKWQHRARSNYFGFLEKREAINIFVAGVKEESAEAAKGIAGVSSEWEDW